ncbi:AzlD domain-containing protein [Collinsella tanakaei]|uniref:branched-chain amino acid transporter permease n=1 Tax=Collinsella tanakaei TaxID=626935 RepID=UPI00195BDBC2|nr:AzlD domain-containing protein [Collinsella tanakaei]MBM6779587.1 AzlD domain-containing protein [Collinsella tanakaei]
MTTLQQIATVLIAGAATVLTRFLPFFAFRHGAPRFIRYLGDVLPGAIFGMLVIYCLKDVDVLAGSHGAPEAIGILVTGGIYLWRRDMLWAILTGTASYMLLVNLVW